MQPLYSKYSEHLFLQLNISQLAYFTNVFATQEQFMNSRMQ